MPATSLETTAATADNRLSVAFIGFGEAATAFVTGWGGGAPARLRAFDVKTDDAATRDVKRSDYAAAGVECCDSDAEAVAGADVIFSLVTADQAFAAASSAAKRLDGPALFFDCNSCAPETKRRSAAVIEAAGGRYVDVAVMAPVHPKLHRTPVLVSGPYMEAALEAMAALDMAAEGAPGEVGVASAIKLCRSVMIKGIEALSAEFILAARSLGVEEAAIGSLEASNPEVDWRKRIGGALERMTVHGLRRAAEMRETAAMVEALGLPSGMSAATAAWQQAVGDLGYAAESGAGLEAADRLAEALRRDSLKG